MSKFLTPPSWYDKNGSEINIFDNTTYGANGPFNTAIGRSAVAGRPLGQGSSFGAVAVGSQAYATNEGAIAIGSYDENGTSRNVSAAGVGSIAIGAGAQASHDGTIAIGRGANAAPGSIAIGPNANTNLVNTIQLGNNNTAYTLNVGKKTYIPGLFDFDSLPKYESSGNTVSDKMRIGGLTTGLYIAYVRIILNEPASSNKFDCRGYKIFDIVNSDSVGSYDLPNVKTYQICSVNASLSYLEKADVNIFLNVSGSLAQISIDKVNYLPINSNEVVFQVYKLSY